MNEIIIIFCYTYFLTADRVLLLFGHIFLFDNICEQLQPARKRSVIPKQVTDEKLGCFELLEKVLVFMKRTSFLSGTGVPTKC